MQKSIIAVALLSVMALAGCMQDPLSRGAAGAVAGAAVADITDSNIATGAVIGGLAGVASCSVPGQCPSY
jgi:osmotically inducible lipoprotein OsmB